MNGEDLEERVDELAEKVADLEGNQNRLEAEIKNVRFDLSQQVAEARGQTREVEEELREEFEEACDKDDLEDRIADLEEVVDPDPGSTDYQSLTRAQKVHRIRRRLVELAGQDRNGKAQLRYKEVKMLFGGRPSDGHCYDLMERAAQLDGFDYDRPADDGQKRIRVNLDGVNDEALVHAANNATGRGEA